MTILASSALSSSQLWYVTRATAVVGFILLTLSFALGLASTRQLIAGRHWPRFATQQLHRNVSMLALGFTLVHIVSSLLDTYVQLSWWSFAVPFVSPYRTLGMAMGTIAFDAIVLVIITSLLRDRLSLRTWRIVHWSAYALWPLAFGHYLLTGTDSGGWGLYLALVSAGVLVVATAARWLTNDTGRGFASVPRVIGIG
jgi:sulfoxide reductase heme-binding subunit YedZ